MSRPAQAAPAMPVMPVTPFSRPRPRPQTVQTQTRTAGTALAVLAVLARSSLSLPGRSCLKRNRLCLLASHPKGPRSICHQPEEVPRGCLDPRVSFAELPDTTAQLPPAGLESREREREHALSLKSQCSSDGPSPSSSSSCLARRSVAACQASSGSLSTSLRLRGSPGAPGSRQCPQRPTSTAQHRTRTTLAPRGAALPKPGPMVTRSRDRGHSPARCCAMLLCPAMPML